MKISASVSPAEHWLTLMNCAICKNTPERSPVYKCNYSHVICYSCFQQLVDDEEVPVCPECESEQFTRHDVSDDFLRKLKTKPGIGRPCRYELQRAAPPPAPRAPAHSEVVTIEELFQMPAQRIQEIFEDCTKEKLTYLSKLTATECLPGRLVGMGRHSPAASLGSCNGLGASPMDRFLESFASRKPLRCPHDGCGKIVAISSFKAHFKYEHFDFKRYYTLRGAELCIGLDPAVFQRGKSICLGIINLGATDDELCTQMTSSSCSMEHVTQPGPDSEELDSFWLMATGSAHEDAAHAHLMLWLFTNSEDVAYNCTMELTSQENIMTMTTFCKVNQVYESQSVADVARGGNFLYLAYATVRSMLMYGPSLVLRLTIH